MNYDGVQSSLQVVMPMWVGDNDLLVILDAGKRLSFTQTS